MGFETRSGKLKGKVPYMSPEQARGEAVDARSDIFAVGVMLFELTTGKRLFKGESEFETLKLICEREYPLPSQVRPGYPPELEPIVMRALAKDRDARYQSAREMQAALEDYVRERAHPRERVALHAVHAVALRGEARRAEGGAAPGQAARGHHRAAAAAATRAPSEGRHLAAPLVQRAQRAGRRAHGDRASAPPSEGAPAVAIGHRPARERRRRGRRVRLDEPPARRASHAVVPAASAAGRPGQPRRHRVSSDPPGAPSGSTATCARRSRPPTIGELPTGRRFDVKLTKDGFEQAKEVVSPDRRRALRQVGRPAHARARYGRRDGQAAPGRAAVTLDGKAVEGFPATGITSGDQHKLVVGAPGYVDQTFTFIAAPQETKHFDVVLVKETHRPHSSSASNGASASTAGSVATTTAPTATEPPPPPPPAGKGKLNVGATGGWCNVSVDGVARGATPIAGLELSAGPHRVVCMPPDYPAMTTSVTISPEATTRYRFKLPQ